MYAMLIQEIPSAVIYVHVNVAGYVLTSHKETQIDSPKELLLAPACLNSYLNRLTILNGQH
jgi:hypothetical protein